MYRSSHHKGDILHTVDLATLRKPNAPNVCKLQQTSLDIINYSNPVLLLLGIHALLQETQNQFDFGEFPFDNIPKQYQQYCHQKTFHQLMGVLRNKGKSIEQIVELLNNYPIFVCVLECWVRRKAINSLESNTVADYMGNQHDLLVDFNIQVRGLLLGIVASSFKSCLKLKFDIFPSIDEEDCAQELGDAYARWELQVIFKGNNVVTGTVSQRQSDQSPTNTYSKPAETGFLRRSKMAETEVQPRGNEFKSAKKERFGPCQRCGQRRCECNQIKRKGFGVTPKNAQLSASIGSKSDPFAIGFLNQHNISKIRESNTGQK